MPEEPGLPRGVAREGDTATKLIHIVAMMIDSGIPCFKSDTLKNLRARFVLDKNEREQ
jgi:hypothetical protein